MSYIKDWLSRIFELALSLHKTGQAWNTAKRAAIAFYKAEDDAQYTDLSDTLDDMKREEA